MSKTQWWSIVIVSTIAFLITVTNVWFGSRDLFSPKHGFHGLSDFDAILMPASAAYISFIRPFVAVLILRGKGRSVLGVLVFAFIIVCMSLDAIMGFVAMGATPILVAPVLLLEVISTFGFTLAGPQMRNA